MCTYNAQTHATLARTRDNQRPTPLPLVLPDVRVAFRATIKTLSPLPPSLPPPVLHSGTITKVMRGKSLCCNNDKQKRGVWEEDDV